MSNYLYLTLPKRKTLDAFKLKGLQTTISNLIKMTIFFPKWLENTVGKGGIARYEQFLLSSTVFSKGLYCRHVKTCLGKD